MVDDEGEHPSEGKQFITVVTKTGNYFYLIIDREDDGDIISDSEDKELV